MPDIKEIYQKNIDVYRQAYIGSADKWIRGECQMEEGILVEAEESYQDDRILVVRTEDGRKRYLAGKYGPASWADTWLEGQGRIVPNTVILVIGMGNIPQLRRMLQQAEGNAMFIIYEPCPNIFQKVLEEYDITDIFQDYPTNILVEGLNAQFVEDAFSRMIRVDNMILTKVFVSGNYRELFPERVQGMLEKLKKYIGSMQVNQNTGIRYTNVVGSNVLNNIAYLYHGYSAEQYKDILPPDVPSVIVSAGPSLDKNIDDLKEAVGRVCIIATDTAVKPLLKHGIKPDFAVIVDGMKPAAQMDYEGTEEIPLLTCTVVSRNFMNRHRGKKVFYADGNPYETGLLELLNRRRKKNKRAFPAIPTGGSVATSAFSFGLYMGSKTIILIGQDLAFTGDKPYADNTFAEKVENIDTSAPQYQEVESIDGGTVMTRADLKLYLEWFEAQIADLEKENTQVRVIDATEGGAMIHGAEIMTLKEAIAETCQKEFSVKEFQDNMEEYFSDAEKARMLSYFHETRFRLERVAKKAREGLHHYEKMLKICRRKEFAQNQYLEIAKKVKKINNFMNTDLTALFVSSNLLGVEYTMRATIYVTEEDEADERIMIAKQGIVLLKNIYYASQDLVRRLPGLVEAYQGDDRVLYERYSEADSKKII